MSLLTHRLLLTVVCAALASLLCGVPRGLGRDATGGAPVAPHAVAAEGCAE